jgi:DNA processing protein
MTRLSDAERLARLRLIRTDGVGPVSFARLLRRFGSGEAALAALPDLAAGNGRAMEPCPPEVAKAELLAAETVSARHIFLGETGYPPRLAELAEAPPVLLAVGDLVLAARPCVAIVGARNASAAGQLLARTLAEALGLEGYAIASGMARGVDAAAHAAALATGTIACIAGGPDIAYPPENKALQERVAETGLLLSEMPPGTEPLARHFPRRNRLIAGVAEAVIVIEAALGSGSLITARIAGEAGREVMAVPGSPLDPRARGGNALLKAGATLVEDVSDVLAALRPFELARKPSRPKRAEEARPPPEAPADAAGQLLALLSPAPVAVDALVRLSGLEAPQVAALLTDFELEGRVVRHAGGRVSAA